MVQDEECPLNLKGMCFEMVAHGFSEEQLREQGRMKLCEMGKDSSGREITMYHYCAGYSSFQNAHKTPGIINPECKKAIHNAKYYGKLDRKIIDLKSSN